MVVVAASGYLQDQYYGTDCIDATFNATCRINATSKANLVMSIPLGLSAVPTPGNFYVNLPPLFLGHFSPIFARFFPVFSPFSPSCRQDSGNRHQDPEKRSVTVEKRRAKNPKFT